MNNRMKEFWTVFLSLLIYAATCFAYAHATFLTRAEHEQQTKADTDREQRVYEAVLRIEGTVNTLLLQKAGEKSGR